MRCRRLTSGELSHGEREQIRALLWASFETFSEDDWRHTLDGTHIVAFEGADVIGHASVVPRQIYVGDRVLSGGYVEGVAVDVSRRRAGVGSVMLGEVGRVIADTYSVGVLSTSAHRFYERLGWRRWHGHTFVIEGGERRRTADEDDGIMVLLVDALGELIDQSLPIAVDARTGDDW